MIWKEQPQQFGRKADCYPSKVLNSNPIQQKLRAAGLLQKARVQMCMQI